MLHNSKIIFSKPNFLKRPYGWVQHTPFAFFLIEALKPDIFVELGTHTGNSYFTFCQAVDELKLKTKCYAVDTWEGDEHSGFYERDVFERVIEVNANNFRRFSSLLQMKFDDALNYFNESSIDLLHIDGCHTYEAVKHDFESWLPKLSSKAVVVLHDTNVKEKGFGVWRYFGEIKHEYLSFEFTHGHGLGVLCVGKEVDKDFIGILEKARRELFIQYLFAALGERILAQKHHEDIKSDIDILRQQLKVQSKEIKKKDIKIQQFENQTEENDKLLKSSIVEYKDLNRILAIVKTDLEKANAKISENAIIIKGLKERINLLESQKDAYVKSLASSKDIIVELESSLKIIKDERSLILSDLEKSKTEIVGLQSAQKGYEQAITLKSELIINLKNTSKILEKELSNTQGQLIQEREKLDQSTKSAQKWKQKSLKQHEIISNKDEIIMQLQADLDNSICLVEKTKQKLDNKEIKLNRLLESLSWRITKPLRVVCKKWASFRVFFSVFSRICFWLVRLRLDGIKKEVRVWKYVRVINKSKLFDSDWYLQSYPDVQTAGVNPVLHYVRRGAEEGRNPNPVFSTVDYCYLNKDVALSEMNPFVHYIQYGQHEGRTLVKVKTNAPGKTSEAKARLLSEIDTQKGQSVMLTNNRFDLAKTILKVHKKSIYPKLEKEAAVANKIYWEWKNKCEAWSPKVMIGTLYCGENEISACKQSIRKQDYKYIYHKIFENLPKKEAMSTLYETFLNSSYDILIKIDADMIVIDHTFVSRVVDVFRHSPDLTVLQMAITDYYTGGPMQGVNAYSKKFTWNRLKQDNLFTDKASVPQNNKLVVWTTFLDSVIHAPLSSDFHSFHFGVHRALKVIKGLKENNQKRAEEQFFYLEKTWNHYLIRKEWNLLMAALGAELAYRDTYTVEELDYINPKMWKDFNLVKKQSKKEIEKRVVANRKENLLCDNLNDLRKHNTIYCDLSLNSVLMLLPHTNIFGGIIRFFELCRVLNMLGVPCKISIPDSKRAVGVSNESTHFYSPEIAVIPLSDAIKTHWDIIVCGDYSSGIANLLPLFSCGLSVYYLLNGWQYRVYNIKQIEIINPDIIIANSGYSGMHYPELSPHIIPGGVNTEIFKPDPGRNNMHKKKSDVFTVYLSGSPKKRVKRFDLGINACKILKQKGWSIEVFYNDDVRTKTEIDYQPVKSFGKIDHFKMAKLYNQVDLVVSSEEDAGWCNTAAEALACQRPLICTRAGTTDFAFHNETALVIESGDPQLIADAIEDLLLNPKKAERIAEAGYNKIQEYSWKNVAQSFISIIGKAKIDYSLRDMKNQKALNKVTELMGLTFKSQ